MPVVPERAKRLQRPHETRHDILAPERTLHHLAQGGIGSVREDAEQATVSLEQAAPGPWGGYQDVNQDLLAAPIRAL